MLAALEPAVLGRVLRVQVRASQERGVSMRMTVARP